MDLEPNSLEGNNYHLDHADEVDARVGLPPPASPDDDDEIPLQPRGTTMTTVTINLDFRLVSNAFLKIASAEDGNPRFDRHYDDDDNVPTLTLRPVNKALRKFLEVDIWKGWGCQG